jgi:hypothetical protein
MTTPEGERLHPSRRLYYWGTYTRTERLEELTHLPSDIRFTQKDLIELFREYVEGCESAPSKPNMLEFAAWLLGSKIHDKDVQGLGFDDLKPAEVFW